MTEQSAPTATLPPQAATPEYFQLIAQANMIFQKSFPGAFTYSATAMPASARARTEADLTKWVFLAIHERGGAELRYSDGAFGKPVPAIPPLGLRFMPLPQGAIRINDAIEILKDHGFTDGFGWVALGTPMYKDPQPMFWFCIDGQTQGVSACSGAFMADLFPCGSSGVFKLPPQ